MNVPRSLILLQPARTGAFVGFFTGFALLFNHVVFHLPWPRNDLFVTGVVTFPLLAGFAVTSCAHAVLHRPFAIVLPRLLTSIRRAAAVAYVALASALMLVIRFVEPRAPMAAVFGLTLALLTLNCPNRRQGFPVLGMFGLLVGGFGVAGGWLIFHLEFASRLLPAMTAAPWAFFVGGIASAATTFFLGFARRSLRDRTATPYFNSAFTWAAMLDRTVLRRQLDETNRFNVRRGIGRRRHARDWAVATVGPRLRDWFRVLDHQRVMPASRQYLVQLVTNVILVILLTALFGVLGLINHANVFHLADYFGALADLTAVGGPHREFNFMMVNSVIVVGLFIPFVQRGLVPRPVLAYPLGRARLADVIFAHTCRQLLATLMIPSAALWVCSFLGQLASHRFQTAFGLWAVAAIDLTLLPGLALFGWTQFSGGISTKRGAINVSGSAFFIGLGVVAVFAIIRASGGSFVLSVPGIACIAIATVVGLVWLRSRIRRHYQSCDLIAEAALAAPFGVAATR